MDILGVYIPSELDAAEMLKGFLMAADDLDSEWKQRMFWVLVAAAAIEVEQRDEKGSGPPPGG